MHSNLTELASYEEVYIDYFVKFMQKLNWQHNGGGGGGFLDTECLGVIKGFFVGYWDKYVECAETHAEGKLVNNGSSNTTNNENYHNYDNHQHISNYNHN
jgi:hypothetical protein